MNTPLTFVEIKPTATHRYTIIWLHGLGADGHDFEGIVPQLRLKNQSQTHFIFPNAPIQAVTINNGMKMRAWYDILEMSVVRKVDIDGILRSATAIEQLIQHEVNFGVKAKNIILAGFSQGGLMALHVGLRYPEKLAGIIALSTYLPTVDSLEKEASAANQNTGIFMAHGTEDTVVSYQAGKTAFEGIKRLHYPIHWHEYTMEHAVCNQEIKEIAAFIEATRS